MCLGEKIMHCYQSLQPYTLFFLSLNYVTAIFCICHPVKLLLITHYVFFFVIKTKCLKRLGIFWSIWKKKKDFLWYKSNKTILSLLLQDNNFNSLRRAASYYCIVDYISISAPPVFLFLTYCLELKLSQALENSCVLGQSIWRCLCDISQHLNQHECRHATCSVTCWMWWIAHLDLEQEMWS